MARFTRRKPKGGIASGRRKSRRADARKIFDLPCLRGDIEPRGDNNNRPRCQMPCWYFMPDEIGQKRAGNDLRVMDLQHIRGGRMPEGFVIGQVTPEIE